MHRSFPSRAGAILAALLVALSAPGSAVAHGEAHHAEAVHDEQHATSAVHVDAEHQSELHEADHPAEHGHQSLGPASTGRADATLMLPAQAVAPFTTTIVERDESPLARTAGPTPSSPDGSSRQPRAPPLG